MDQTNTQAGQNAQSLQPGASQTQGSTSPLQTGAGAGLAGNDSSDILNQGVSTGNLSVGVAGTSSRTSIDPVNSTASATPGIPGFFALIPLVLFLFALILAYRRTRKFDGEAENDTPAEEDILDDLTWTTKVKNKKKKRKKPKKPHHH